MKVLVISDTHGKIENVKALLEVLVTKGVEAVLHCGDYFSDAKLIEKSFPKLQVVGVHGNCDVGFGAGNEEVVELEGVSIFMTHGHGYGIKWGDYEDLIIDAVANDAQIAVFGHSHEAFIKKQEDIWLLNPGSISLPRDSQYPSYAIIDLYKGEIKEISLMQLVDKNKAIIHPATYCI